MASEFSRTTEVIEHLNNNTIQEQNAVGLAQIRIEDTSVSSIATNLNQTQGYSINGNLRQSNNEKEAMPDRTRLQDINKTSFDDGNNSTVTNSGANSNQILPNENHHPVSSSCSSFSIPPTVSAATNETTIPTVEPATSETDACEANIMNNTNAQNVVNATGLSTAKGSSSCDGYTLVDGLVVGGARTILKEDGLKDIIIPVPVFQRPPPCHVGQSGANGKSHNGHGAFKSGNMQMRKRPVLVRKATPIKIETPFKIINDRIRTSCENNFAEEDEEEEEEAAAAGVSI